MKKYLITAFALLLTLPQLIIAQGYIATYTMKVSDVPQFAKEMDILMASDWGQAFPGYVSLTHYAFNGYDDATHAVIINYDDTDQMASGTEMFYQPAFGTFLAKTSSYVEAVEQSLHMKLISGGESDPEKNKDAVKFENITFKEVIEKGLKVMDMTAFTLSEENNLPIIVFDMNTNGNLMKLISGENIGTIVNN